MRMLDGMKVIKISESINLEELLSKKIFVVFILNPIRHDV